MFKKQQAARYQNVTLQVEPLLPSFDPFLSAVLRELHERVEDVTMAALCAIDRVVLPVDARLPGTSGRVQKSINASGKETCKTRRGWARHACGRGACCCSCGWWLWQLWRRGGRQEQTWYAWTPRAWCCRKLQRWIWRNQKRPPHHLSRTRLPLALPSACPVRKSNNSGRSMRRGARTFSMLSRSSWLLARTFPSRFDKVSDISCEPAQHSRRVSDARASAEHHSD